MSVDDLRQQLRERGYLTHGIERWFALDPWSSRAFWLELGAVAVKASVLIGAFGALPPTAVMLFRNMPLRAGETLALFVTYALTGAVLAFVLTVAAALLLKVRPGLPIDTPRALLAISLGFSGLLTMVFAFWWWRFDAPPDLPELAAGSALAVIFFVVAATVVSAALLSFSIYEVKRIPAIHRVPHTVPMLVTAAVLTALLFIPALLQRDAAAAQPMVVTSPTTARLALVGVDGLTFELLHSRPDLARAFARVTAVPAMPGGSTTERWASLGTGVPTTAHRVRAIEGVRFRGGSHVLQRISRADLVLVGLAPAAGLARREPLPPAVRMRDYVWEIVASRGTPAVSVNWWATGDSSSGALRSVGAGSVFAAAKGDPLTLDALAAGRLRGAVRRHHPQLAAVYLPALDVILNRLQRDEATRLAQSLRALDGIVALVSELKALGFDVVLAGLPGDEQSGRAVIATSMSAPPPASAWDVAPLLLDRLGFPLSHEMPGSAPGGEPQPRIPGYGARSAEGSSPELNREYYDTLRSLGYIR